jgi:putative flippase GtrA
VVGLTAAIVDISLFQGIMLFNPDWHYLAASTVSFCFATWVNYWVGLTLLFNPGLRFSRSKEISLVYLVSAVGLLVHHTGFYLVVEHFSFPLIFGKIVGMGFAFFWNFSARYFWIFKS